MKRTIAVGLMLALGALSLAACDKSASSGGAAATETTSGGGSVGIKECDDYLAKAESCPAMKAAAGAQRTAWTEAAKNAAAKPGLATGCKAALDAMVQSGACK